MDKSSKNKNSALEACRAGINLISNHPLFMPMWRSVYTHFDDKHQYVSSKGWLTVSPRGHFYFNAQRRLTPVQWARMIAQALVALGFGLVQQRSPQQLWELAALKTVTLFCDELKISPLPEELQSFGLLDQSNADTEAQFRQWVVDGCPDILYQWHHLYCGGLSSWYCQLEQSQTRSYHSTNWGDLFVEGITQSVQQALEVAGGYQSADNKNRTLTPAQRARRQLIDTYPLLGALAAGFELVEDIRLCGQYDIRVAAIDVGAQKIWMNPAAALKQGECLFVFAHELLHAGLNHASRRRGRDPYLWNVACDFAINGWLMQMQIGTPPSLGLLYDSQFDNASCEEIYDHLAQDIRKARKLVTLRGNVGDGDILGEDQGSIFTNAEEYCRRALSQGLERCLYGSARTTLPAGLIEEIRSLSQPPIPWDVRLAEWFDEHFPPLEYHRSYAHPSRRQSATPNIPRPSLAKPSEEMRLSRVFGVLLDTSGSMNIQLLGKALGAIASYALAHDVQQVRFICCDAQAYDKGWVMPEQLLYRFALEGRGGTVLQPGINLLSQLSKRGEFPAQGPILIITDGGCEQYIDIQMEHAWLLPEGHRLPFIPRGEVFTLR
ncbi:hypothetical protein [Serratia sp. DD3]|uniref:vWA domain-containing protein n=1 Tax=Serratia sp. DD3 TaxID=1410619 RepID=UPI0003C4E276|nr:hypothetical protein [Serratia sp. DD3]KEY58937.1 hypothetical protein SRDD_21330 [Serratia sp. DD3]